MLISPLHPTPFIHLLEWIQYSEIFQHMTKDKRVRSSMCLDSHPIYEASSCIPHSQFLPSAARRFDDLCHDLLHPGNLIGKH